MGPEGFEPPTAGLEPAVLAVETMAPYKNLKIPYLNIFNGKKEWEE
jgi:hypothetical protein